MLQAMFSGVSGLQAHQTKLNVAGNNIANVNTIGFKAGRVTFQDQLSQTLRTSAQPSSETGGQNPAQVGLGVALGAVDTLQTQGNLQTTGKPTDIAIQGNGFFLVSSGENVYYTRDGSFDLDSDGVMVNPASGLKLLGYVADEDGNIDQSQQITNESVIKVPVGSLTSLKQTTEATLQGNLDATAALRTTFSNLSGNFTAPASLNTTVYDDSGRSYNVNVRIHTPVDAGANTDYTMDITVGSQPVQSRTISFDKATNAPVAPPEAAVNVAGLSGAPDFAFTLNYGGARDVAGSSSLSARANGQSGPPPSWNSSLRVFDSLGVSHLLNIKFTRQHVGSGPTPTGTQARWDWAATEDGRPIASSAAAGNSALYFDSKGRLLNTDEQSLTVTPINGASALPIKLDFSTITQLAGDSSVATTAQDGFQVGTLQNFTTSQDGLITGIFSNGQSRVLGQITLAHFSNPAGLEKLGQNLFRDSANSGLAQTGLPLLGGRGKISTGFVEMSNVDLSNEFTNLIITQRGFQANTRIVTIVDDLLQEVINLKR